MDSPRIHSLSKPLALMFSNKLRDLLYSKGRWGLEVTVKKNLIRGRCKSSQLCRFVSTPRSQSELNGLPVQSCKQLQEDSESSASIISSFREQNQTQRSTVLGKKKQNAWPGLTGEFADNFKKVMISREYDIAMELFRRMKAVGHKPKSTVLNGLLTLCHTKAHLSCALEIFAELSSMECTPNDSAYMALIRCYSDGGQVDIALSLIDKMKALSMELKLRTYHPILEAASSLGDFECSLSVVKQMMTDQIIPRSEHFTLLLEAAASSGAINSTVDVNEIDLLLRLDTLDLLDMDVLSLQRIVAAFRNLSLISVRDEGVMTTNNETGIPILYYTILYYTTL